MISMDHIGGAFVRRPRFALRDLDIHKKWSVRPTPPKVVAIHPFGTIVTVVSAAPRRRLQAALFAALGLASGLFAPLAGIPPVQDLLDGESSVDEYGFPLERKTDQGRLREKEIVLDEYGFPVERP